MRRAARVVFASSAFALLAACASDGSTDANVSLPRALFETAITLPRDPTLHGARYVPLDARAAIEWGSLPDGSTRAMLRGYRLLETRDGGMRVSSTRLPQDANVVTPLPERMGGGALFASGSTIFRADDWLGDVTPVFLASGAITAIYVGLDRVYVRTQNGSNTAMNPRTGERMDLGPWPKSPTVGGSNGRGYVAPDAWRAAAIADFSGVVLTTDAGGSWKQVATPVDAKELRVVDGKILAGDPKHPESWVEIRNDGSTLHATQATPEKIGSAAVHAAIDASNSESSAIDRTERTPFGPSPLESAAIEGWPLGDGTAVVARDGQLARVRIDGGVIVDLERRAFPQNPARCKAIPLGDFQAKGSFGFSCAEPEGKTAIYSFDAARGAMSLVREWKKPRIVIASGNGAVAVRGGCDEDKKLTAENVDDYCVMSTDKKWRAVNVTHQAHETNASSGDRVVVLRDGRFVIVTPPTIDGTGARVTVFTSKNAKTVDLHFQGELVPDAARVLRAGVWLDGMEEVEDNVIAGWVEAAGVMLGVRISLDGETDVGQFIRDAGSPMVSGRYGLGWTAGKRGYETTDFGRTWTSIDVPDHESVRPEARGCGPIGCTGPGWLRIGWGTEKTIEVKPKISTPPSMPLAGAPRTASLVCEAIEPVPPSTHNPEIHAQASVPPPRRIPPGYAGIGSFNGIYGMPSLPTSWPSFYGVSAPTLPSESRGFSGEATDAAMNRSGNYGSLARLYAWGPKSTELDPGNSHLQFRWLSPFSGWQNVRSSRATAAPQDVIDWFKVNAGSMQHSFIPGDDDDHGMLVSRRGYGTSTPTLTVLETDRAPIEVHRADGEPFVEVDAAMHALGHWYIAAPLQTNERSDTVIWRVDGGVARELVRVRRAAIEGRPAGTKLARREGGRTIGLLVDGQPLPDGHVAIRWVLPIDVETGATGEPESLGSNDFSDRKELGPCRNADDAWIFDTQMGGTTRFKTTDGEPWSSTTQFVRARVTHDAACLEAIATSTSTLEEEAHHAFARAHPSSVHRADAIRMTVLAERMRYALSCVAQ